MNYYHRISTLPMLRFHLINKTGDLTLLLKSPDLLLPKDIEFEVVWNRIYTEFLDYFKLHENLLYWKFLKKKYANLAVEAMNDDKKYLKTFAEVIKKEADDLINMLEGGDIATMQTALEKHHGRKFDPMEETVVTWFKAINKMNKNI